jgi:Spy/CpxP family protein refolding chaperone
MQQGKQDMQRGVRGPGTEMGRQPFLNPQRLKAAGATDEQLKALKAFADEQEIKKIDLKAEAEKAQLALKQVMSSDSADEAAAFAALDRVSQTRTAIAKQGISAKFKVREIFGDDVAKKLREMGPPKGKGPDGQRVPGSQGCASAGAASN